ncbi:MAG: hypothetical protein ACRD7E_01480, partial [Bryobacteraceae bacterium]
MLLRLTAILAFATGSLFAATVDKPDPSAAEIEKIISTFAANESAFAKARENYTYRQTARIQEMDEGGIAGGKFELVSDIVFGPDGQRTERIVRAPVSTLRHIQMTAEDEQDIR